MLLWLCLFASAAPPFCERESLGAEGGRMDGGDNLKLMALLVHPPLGAIEDLCKRSK